MKLRQKLAVVLASAMAVTAVPVVTFATATTQTKREVITIEKDKAFMEVATANAVKITFDNEAIDADAVEVVYLTLENAEWEDAAFDEAYGASVEVGGLKTWNTLLKGSDSDDINTTFEKQGDKVMKITMELNGDGANNTYYLPLLAKAKGGDAKVTIENKGNGMLSKKNTYIFATTGEKKFTIKADDPKSFYRTGELAKLTLTEAFPGSLKNGGKFKLELDDTGYYFDGTNIEVKGMYGFGGKIITASLDIEDKDRSAATITIDGVTGDSSLGVIEITGIKVRTNDKEPDEGDFLVDIKKVDDCMADDMNNVVLGKVAKYATYIKMKDDKVKDVKAGRIEEIEFEVGEQVEDSMISDREFELTLENGHWDYVGLANDYYTSDEYVGADVSDKLVPGDDCKKLAAKIDKVWLAKKILSDKDDWNVGTGKGKTNVEFDVDDDGKVIPETLIVNLGEYKDKGALQNNKEIDKIKFKIKACVPVDNKEKEKVTIKAEGRALETEVSTTAINIIDPFKVTYDQAVLKTGLQGQVSGAVTITETDKDCFQRGKLTFKVKKDDEEFGIYLTDAKAEVSSSLKGTKVDVKKGNSKNNASMNIDLNRVSKEAATITFKEMKFTTDRTVPEGTYDLEISGGAVDADGHTLVIKDFIKITTANTQDITNANGLAAATAVFTIDSTKYTVNGVEYDMDAPAYIAGAGSTMIPMRYVASAFGVAPENILFSNGTATFFAGSRTIQLTTGSDVTLVNGAPIKMAVKVENKNGRLFVPVGEVANILSVSKSWDPATKTATFSNVNTDK